jgi:hypothetical protein
MEKDPIMFLSGNQCLSIFLRYFDIVQTSMKKAEANQKL